jgi:rhodanese-related sulfurtransferase
MNKICMLVYVALLSFVGSAFALSDQEFETLRQAADRTLSATPEKGYLITADELSKRIQSGAKDFIVVDVREKEAKFKAGHIPGAIYIDAKEIAKTENLAKLPKDKDVILYCNTGHEENKALAMLRMLGYNAYGLKFGYVAWKREKPTEMMLTTIGQADKAHHPVEH